MRNVNFFVVLVLLMRPLTVSAQDTLTPGRAALLVEPKGASDVAQLKMAIADADPAVRAVAARVTGVLGRTDLASPLQQLLEREAETTAAAEQIRTLLSLKGVDAVPQASAAAARLGGGVVQPLAEWLARTDPQRFVAMVPELIRITDAPPIVGALAAMGLRQTPATGDSISTALSTSGSSSAWTAFLDALKADLSADILRKGLTSKGAPIREATVWFLVLNRSRETTDNLKAVISESKQINPSEVTEWTSFGYDLLGRRAGEKGTDHSAAIAKVANDHKVELGRLARHPDLTAEERAALTSALPETKAIGEKTSPTSSPTPLEGEAKPSGLPTRMFQPIVPGFFRSLLAAVRCTPSGGSTFGAARLSYRIDGHVKAVGLDNTTLSESCGTFLRLLARLAVAQSNARIVDTESQWLFIAMDKASIDCVDADTRATPTTSDANHIGGGVVTPPRKIKDVRPVYPPSMQRAGIQGAVIIEAIISTEGCVRAGEVLRGVELPLDLAAMKAVSGWRFEPTMLGGIPVQVVMTATVTFRLQ